MSSIMEKFFEKKAEEPKAEEPKVEAVAEPTPTPTEFAVAIISKRPPHGYSVTLHEKGEKKKHDFNSKEAMCIFLGSRPL